MPYRAAGRRAVRLPRRRHRRDRAAARDRDEGGRDRRSSSSVRHGLRDRLIAVQKAIAKQQMVADKNEDIDVIGIADDELEASVQVFFVRRGRVVGPQGVRARQGRGAHARAGWSTGSSRRCTATSRRPGVPKQVLVPVESEDVATYEEWLCAHARGRGCRSGCPSEATSGRCSRPSRATPARSSRAIACAGPTDHNSRAAGR